MKRPVLVYLLLVLLPAAGLAVFAFRVADWAYTRRLDEHAGRVKDEAEALARRVEEAIAAAARRAEESGVAGYARDGHWIGYSPDPPADPAAGATAGELRYYRLSLAGGESYEHARGDPGRALDAYAFYLPRIRAPALRTRLEHHAARAALAAGEERLGAEMLRRLFTGAEGVVTEEGLPIDLLAAARLLALASPDADTLRAEASARLRKAQGSISTPLLARLTAAFAPEDAAMRRMIDERRRLEAAVLAHPEVLAAVDAVFDRASILLAGPHARASSVREIRFAVVDLPPLAAGELEVRLEGPVPAAASSERAARPIRLGSSGSILATLVASDPGLEAKMAAADLERSVTRALVGLLVLVTLGGGVALVRFLSRERHLARLRARLLANVSHELKTPVTSIRMFSEMLAEDSVGEAEARRFGKLLAAESSRLSQLVENLLDFSRLGRKEESLAREPVDVAALLRRVAEGFAVRAREQKVELRLEGLSREGDDGAGPVVETNAAAVERILLNLLDNALKYRRQGAAWIRLALAADPGPARITVADNGIGIPGRDRQKVFEELYRVHYDDYAVKGSGLGLSIALRLARKLGGDITLESAEGAGSAFTLTLPLKEHASADPHR